MFRATREFSDKLNKFIIITPNMKYIAVQIKINRIKDRNFFNNFFVESILYETMQVNRIE